MCATCHRASTRASTHTLAHTHTRTHTRTEDTQTQAYMRSLCRASVCAACLSHVRARRLGFATHVHTLSHTRSPARTCLNATHVSHALCCITLLLAREWFEGGLHVCLHTSHSVCPCPHTRHTTHRHPRAINSTYMLCSAATGSQQEKCAPSPYLTHSSHCVCCCACRDREDARRGRRFLRSPAAGPVCGRQAGVSVLREHQQGAWVFVLLSTSACEILGDTHRGTEEGKTHALIGLLKLI